MYMENMNRFFKIFFSMKFKNNVFCSLELVIFENILSLAAIGISVSMCLSKYLLSVRYFYIILSTCIEHSDL